MAPIYIDSNLQVVLKYTDSEFALLINAFWPSIDLFSKNLDRVFPRQMYRLRRDLNHSKIVRKKASDDTADGGAPSISVEQATPPPGSRPLTPSPSMASGLNMIIDSKVLQSIQFDVLPESSSLHGTVNPL